MTTDRTLDRDVLAELIAEHLSGTYHCTRVWSAWGVGTMTQDDFEPVDESDTPGEIADAIIAKLNADRTQSAQAEPADWWRKRADEIELRVAQTGSPEAMCCFTDMRTLLQSVAQAQPAVEPVAYLHDDGFWTAVATEQGRALSDRLRFAGSPKVGVHLHPAPALDALDAETAIKNCLEAGETMRVLKRVVNLLLESRRNLGPEDHELRDRIDQLFRPDAAIAAQSAQGAKP